MPEFDRVTEQLMIHAAHSPVLGSSIDLDVVEGPATGKRFHVQDLSHRRALLGSSPACEVHVDDRTVSRRHAALELDRDGLRLIDLGSRNGTYVGGYRASDVRLRSGDEFIIGSTKLRVTVEAGEHEIAASQEGSFMRLIGASPAMRRIYPALQRLAVQLSPVLVEGEAGTGKELLAECIHESGPLASGPFVVCEPAALPSEALDVELFGGKGEPGLVQTASGGTLFIDEVADLPLPVQVKLLRLIEHRGNAPAQQARIIASTKQNLERRIQDRLFREDLFLALAAVRIELPPLRKRTTDIPILTHYFWSKLGGNTRELPPDLLQRFEQHDWPGNVRELQAAVSRAIVTGERDVQPGKRAPEADIIGDIISRNLPLPRARQEIVLELERRYTQAMLDRHGGHVGRAAEASGIGRRYFQAIRAKR